MFPVNAFSEGFIRGLFFTEKGLLTVNVLGLILLKGYYLLFLFCNYLSLLWRFFAFDEGLRSLSLLASVL